MKIKLFESFNDEDYYRRIDYRYYNNILSSSNLSDFSELEIERIKSLYSNDKIPLKHEYVFEKSVALRISLANNIEKKVKYIRYQFIYKLEDEWYILVYVKPEFDIYYLCDQFEGLLKCIKDTKIKYQPNF